MYWSGYAKGEFLIKISKYWNESMDSRHFLLWFVVCNIQAHLPSTACCDIFLLYRLYGDIQVVVTKGLV